MVWQLSPACSWEPVWLLACWNEVWKPGSCNVALTCTFQALCWVWVRMTDSGTVTLLKTFSPLNWYRKFSETFQHMKRLFTLTCDPLCCEDFCISYIQAVFQVPVRFKVKCWSLRGFSSHGNHVSDTPLTTTKLCFVCDRKIKGTKALKDYTILLTADNYGCSSSKHAAIAFYLLSCPS